VLRPGRRNLPAPAASAERDKNAVNASEYLIKPVAGYRPRKSGDVGEMDRAVRRGPRRGAECPETNRLRIFPSSVPLTTMAAS
jgi:hypothetical protein